MRLLHVLAFMIVLSVGLFYVRSRGGGSSTRQKTNQTRNLLSPSGKYILDLPIRKNLKYSSKSLVWIVTISDAKGKMLYSDPDSHFVGYLNVYWTWDSSDRAWMYNSDDGLVYFWELQDGAWTKSKWGYGRTKKAKVDFSPPEGLYPHYVK